MPNWQKLKAAAKFAGQHDSVLWDDKHYLRKWKRTFAAFAKMRRKKLNGKTTNTYGA